MKAFSRSLLSMWSRLRRSRLRFNMKGILAGALILGLLIASLLASILTPYEPTKQHLREALQRPTRAHLLGTDQFGRDILTRILYGLRITFLVGVISCGGSMVVGVTLGGIAAFWRQFDGVIMRAVDILLAFPSLLLALILISVLGTGLVNVMLALGIHTIPSFARVARGEVLRVASSDYVLSAQAIGASKTYISLRHILPNILPMVTVLFVLRLAIVVLGAASLGFLGMGVPPPTPDLGAMLAEARDYMRLAPHLSIFPGIAILLFVFAFNVLGGWLQDRFDPRLKGSR
ncbi:ABC transporter permease [Candidatus Bipolaricaulota bacterium]